MPGDDSNDLRNQQASYNGTAKSADVYAPYGISYNIPPGSYSIYSLVSGDPGDIVVLPDRPNDRVKGLKSGEFATFNPLTKSRMVYKQNGDIVVNVEGDNGDMLVTIKKDNTVNVGGNVNLNVDGDVNITAQGDANVSATNINLN